MQITYILRRISTGTIVGHGHESQAMAEREAQELAYVNTQTIAVIETLDFGSSQSYSAMSIVGATGVLVRLA